MVFGGLMKNLWWKKSFPWPFVDGSKSHLFCIVKLSFPWIIHWPVAQLIQFLTNGISSGTMVKQQCLTKDLKVDGSILTGVKYWINCPYLDIKHWKDKFLIEICSWEVFYQTFSSDSERWFPSYHRRFIIELNFSMAKKITYRTDFLPLTIVGLSSVPRGHCSVLIREFSFTSLTGIKYQSYFLS